ncbi:PH domain-containing protein [Streptomyces sp. NPDC001407]|uniref:PH domain-containing protein n=1 Tax=Streptomyces sp. NPDC001407 TaxID=3364573 RepID=UPI00367A34B9
MYGPDAVAVLRSEGRAPRRARLASLTSHALSYTTGDDHLAVGSGLFWRNAVHVAPTGKIQRVDAVQGPWQRRLRLASVVIHLAGGHPLVARHRHAAEAAAIADNLRTRSTPTPCPGASTPLADQAAEAG